jgi:hypothetical protein
VHHVGILDSTVIALGQSGAAEKTCRAPLALRPPWTVETLETQEQFAVSLSKGSLLLAEPFDKLRANG